MGFLINSIFFDVRLNWKRRKASCGARKQHCRRWKFYKLWFSYRENKTIFGCHGCQHGCARAFRLTCSRCYVHFTIKMWLKNERRMSLWRHNQLESNRQREINFNCGWSHRVLQSWLVLQSSQPITSRLNWQTSNNVTRSSANQDNWPETCNIYWRFIVHLTLVMTSAQVVESSVNCYQKQRSFSGLHSPGQS